MYIRVYGSMSFSRFIILYFTSTDDIVIAATLDLVYIIIELSLMAILIIFSWTLSNSV